MLKLKEVYNNFNYILFIDVIYLNFVQHPNITLQYESCRNPLKLNIASL